MASNEFRRVAFGPFACLALDVPRSAVRGGFWTPATALGDKLVTRLRRHADVEFEVLAD